MFTSGTVARCVSHVHHAETEQPHGIHFRIVFKWQDVVMKKMTRHLENAIADLLSPLRSCSWKRKASLVESDKRHGTLQCGDGLCQ